MFRRLPAALILAPVLAGLIPTVAAAGASPSDGVPPDQPAKGLVYEGLTPARNGGPCDPGHPGHFEIRSPAGRLLGCTHGPDAAPAGVSLDAPTPAELAARQAEDQGLPCIGDGISGYRVQAIYAYPADMASRYASVAPLIRGWASTNVDEIFSASAAESGGTRRVRFVTNGACEVVVDQVALTAAGDDTFSNTISQLRSLGYTRPDRKYMVWMDTPGGRSSIYCGIAQLYLDDSDSITNHNNGHTSVQGMVSRIDAGCWGSTGTPVEAHELMHNLGGVQSSAPHSTGRYPSPAGGHCTDDNDVMCYDDDGGGPAGTTVVCASTAAERRFDCGDDDYFSTSPPAGSYLDTHWNAADSRFLDGTVSLAPANDHFADAITVAGVIATIGGSTLGATKEAGEPSHAGQSGGASVWYRWEAPASGPVTVRTAGSSFDTLLGVYIGGSVGGLSMIASNDDAPDGLLTSEAAFNAAAGTVYRIAVDGYGGDVGAVVVAVTPGAGASDPDDEGSGPALALSSSRKRVRSGTRVRLSVSAPGCAPGTDVEVVAGTKNWRGSLGDACQAIFSTRVRRKTTFRGFAFDDLGDVVARSYPVVVGIRRA
jgi:hypothetical protein